MSEGQPEVTVYRTRSCPFCVGAERLLRARGIEFEEIHLDGRADRREVVAGIMPGHRTVPLIVIDGDPIGGYEALLQLDASGELDRRLGRTS